MQHSALTESLVLAEWAEQECRHFDLIANWETLLELWKQLGFEGPATDELRLAEFKKVIGQTNKFLTRMKNGLARTRTIEDAIEFLGGYASVTDVSEISDRTHIAYNKLKQQWVMTSVYALRARLEQMQEQQEEGKRDE